MKLALLLGLLAYEGATAYFYHPVKKGIKNQDEATIYFDKL